MGGANKSPCNLKSLSHIERHGFRRFIRDKIDDGHTSKLVAFWWKGIVDFACALLRGFVATKVSTRHHELMTK